MTERLRRVSFLALSIITSYTVVVATYVAKHPVVTPVIDGILIFVSSVELYRLLVDLLFKAIATVPLLLRLYWGRLYVDGLWSYTYTLDSDEPGIVYFGVWKFEQNLFDTTVTG